MIPPLRIAVADDELDMRDYFVRMLPRRGYEVVSVAETGTQLVQQCRELSPDLVITDIKMPGMDGITAAAAIWCERPVPVILISAHFDEVPLTRTSGQMFFLRKPFVYADLEMAIETAVREFIHLAPP